MGRHLGGNKSNTNRKLLGFGLAAVLATQVTAISSNLANAQVIDGCNATITNSFGGGDGSSNTPYLICNRDQLELISTSLASNFLLKTNIDLAGEDWVPLGPKFSGVFDGGHYRISNGVIRGNPNNGGTHPSAIPSTDPASEAGTDLYGFFAMVSGTVKNLDLANFVVTSETDADISVKDLENQVKYSYQGRFPLSGVVVGGALDGSVFSEIRVTNSQVSGKNSAAGIIAGSCYEDCLFDLIDARSSTNVVETTAAFGSDTELGGIVGGAMNASGTISVSRAIFGGRVGNEDFDPAPMTRTQTAGIVGYAYGSAEIDQVMVTGVIQGSKGAGDQVAGIITRAELASNPVVRNSVFTGELDVASNDAVAALGGIVDLAVGPVSNVLMLGTMPVSRWSGTATEFTNVGPIAGRDLNSGAGWVTVSQGYYNRDILSAFNDNAELGDGRTTFELQNLSTFNDASWSIAAEGASSVTLPIWTLDDYNPSTQTMDAGSKVWKLAEDNYPSLVWLEYWPRALTAASAVTATSPSAGVANLTWVTSAGQFTGYKVESSLDGGNTWVTQIANTGSSQTSASVSGLTAGATYRFRISTLATGSFDRPVSVSSNAVLMGSDPTAPQNLTAVRLSENSFRVSWDPPSNTGGLSITSYTLQVDKGSGYETVAHTGTSAEITGVSISSLWSFRVLATNVVGSSSYAVFTNTPPVPYSGPIVTSFSAREVVADRTNSVTLDGMRLSQVTELFIGTTKLSFTRASTDQLVVSLPALAKGVYDLRMVYTGGGVITHQAAFTALDALVVLPSRTLLFTNFAGDGFRLPAAASRGIRSAISSLGSASKIVCVGSTSGTRATASDRRLALRRAQEACNLAKRLVPGVVTEVRANPASGLGARFRSVSITITGN